MTTEPASDHMDDDGLRAVGMSILLGEHESPTTLTPAELRRAVELATDDVSRLLAPFGFVVRPISEKASEPPQAGAGPNLLTAVFVLAVIVIVVMYVVATDAGVI